MNETTVETLLYELKLSNDLAFDNPPALEVDFPSFKFKLEKGILEIKMEELYSTEIEARNVVEPHIKAWELDVLLTEGRKKFWFEFLRSVIVDMNPFPLDGSKVIHVGVAEIIFAGFESTAVVTKKMYPQIQHQLLQTPDVESLVKRYENFINGKEPLLSMAYFCLSLLQANANGRYKASNKYNIDESVLKMLGNLTSEYGDKTEARKLNEKSTLKPLTGAESTWILETIKIIIRRKAEYDYDPTATFPKIVFQNLPPI